MSTELYEEELLILNLGSSTELQVDMPSGPSLELNLQLDPDISMNHFALSNIGVNTHVQIDNHISNTSNPHSVTKTQVGLGNVDNTSDLNKPISTATQTALDLKSNIGHVHALSDLTQSGATSGQVPSWNGSTWVPVTSNSAVWGSITGTLSNQTDLQSALDLKANLASPALTGNPTAPTQSGGNNSTRIATTAFVTNAVTASATPDATVSVKGKIQLTGDLGGSASSPTVPKLANPYYTTGNSFPTGTDFSTALDLQFESGYSNRCLLILDASAASGSGVVLGPAAINREVVLVNESVETITIYPYPGDSIFPDITPTIGDPYYLRGYATARLIGRDSTTWRLQVSPVDLTQPYVFGVLPQSKGGTGTVDGSGLPYMSKFGDTAQGTYQFDLGAFGAFYIYDTFNPYSGGFYFRTSTASSDYFELLSSTTGTRIIGNDMNNNLLYIGGNTGTAEGICWNQGLNRIESSSTVLFGNWEFDGVDTLQDSDGILITGQLKYWDNSAFDLSNAGINFMNSGVNIGTIANGANLGVGTNASATRKIMSLSTSAPQLTLCYNTSSLFVDATVASTGGLTFKPASNTTSGFRWQNSAGTTDILSINTTNTEVNMNIGANTVGFLRGGSNITPMVVIGASGGKAVALLAGSAGTAFQYDSTGSFNIATEARATMIAGTTSGGVNRVQMNSSGNIAFLGSTGVTNTSPVDYVQVGDPAGVNQSFGASEARIRFGTSNRVTISQNNGNSSGGVAMGDGTTYANIGANAGRMTLNAKAGDTLGCVIGASSTPAWSAISPVNYSTGTAGQSTTTVTGVGTTWTSAMIGMVFTWNVASATAGIITAVGSTTSLTVSNSQTVSTGSTYRISYPGIQVSSTGQVGIGGTPSELLTVKGLTTGTSVIGLEDGLRASASQYATITFSSASSNSLTFTTLYSGGVSGTGGNAIIFKPGNSEAARFSQGGYLGLGTATTPEKLTISAGNIQLDSTYWIGTSSSKNIFSSSGSAVVVDFDINASSTANNTFFRLGNGTMSTASSGVTKILSSTPSINQSGTAGYTAFNINITETGTGSGAKNLVLFSVGGTEKFSIDNGGIVKASAQVRLKGYTVATLPAGTQGDTAFVTDALAPTFNTTIVGGGTVVTKVFYNGTNWIAG